MKSSQTSPTPEILRRRYARLKARLADPGWILRGTITERFDTRESPKGSGRFVTRGPYDQWTFKRRGKTVTVNLTASQAKVYEKAIANHRKLEKVLREMREVSLEYLEATTESVRRRKPRETPDFGLS